MLNRFQTKSSDSHVVETITLLWRVVFEKQRKNIWSFIQKIQRFLSAWGRYPASFLGLGPKPQLIFTHSDESGNGRKLGKEQNCIAKSTPHHFHPSIQHHHNIVIKFSLLFVTFIFYVSCFVLLLCFLWTVSIIQ